MINQRNRSTITHYAEPLNNEHALRHLIYASLITFQYRREHLYLLGIPLSNQAAFRLSGWYARQWVTTSCQRGVHTAHETHGRKDRNEPKILMLFEAKGSKHKTTHRKKRILTSRLTSLLVNYCTAFRYDTNGAPYFKSSIQPHPTDDAYYDLKDCCYCYYILFFNHLFCLSLICKRIEIVISNLNRYAAQR